MYLWFQLQSGGRGLTNGRLMHTVYKYMHTHTLVLHCWTSRGRSAHTHLHAMDWTRTPLSLRTQTCSSPPHAPPQLPLHTPPPARPQESLTTLSPPPCWSFGCYQASGRSERAFCQCDSRSGCLASTLDEVRDGSGPPTSVRQGWTPLLVGTARESRSRASRRLARCGRILCGGSWRFHPSAARKSWFECLPTSNAHGDEG